MNRKPILLFVAFLMALAVNASPVDVQKAKEIGVKILRTDKIQLVKTYSLKNGDPAFYVFNKERGFVMVSADDCAIPVLAYSDEGIFDEHDVPVQMRDYLERFVAQIQFGVDNQIVANDFTARQWENVKETGCLVEQRNTTVVTPLLTSRWNQNYPYNRFCPTAPGGPGNHAYAGCVAVAMGQIMRFWGYPETGQGSHGGVDFGNITYQWNQMLDAIPNDPDISEIRPIATLLWHCGVAVDMQYSASGSGADVADVPNAMVTYFKYASDMQHEYKECEGDVYYTDSQWIEKIKNCLDLGRPILYGAADDNIGMGHAFVCDGYDGNDMLHFNWGWSGAGNAYYALGALNVTSATGYNYYFNTCNSAIFNIHPANVLDTQTTTLAEGWNWFSTYMAINDPEEAMSMLQESLGENGLIIKSIRNFTTYEDDEWGATGDLEELDNVHMYMIQVVSNCTVELQGTQANVGDYEIPIVKGWNWIGFPSAVAIGIEDAFADFEATDGDKIKSKNDYSTYNAEEGWGDTGDLEELIPGQGFMYYSNSNTPKILVFSLGR